LPTNRTIKETPSAVRLHGPEVGKQQNVEPSPAHSSLSLHWRSRTSWWRVNETQRASASSRLKACQTLSIVYCCYSVEGKQNRAVGIWRLDAMRRNRRPLHQLTRLHLMILFSAGTLKAKFHYASWFGAGSEPVRSLFGASSELASVMEFGFYPSRSDSI